jgi:hypothetical protein
MTHTTDTTTTNPNQQLVAWHTDGFVRKATRSRVTGTVVRILDLKDPASTVLAAELAKCDESHRWATACEHDLFTTQARLKQSDFDAAHPEQWCDQCLAAATERGNTDDLT